MTDLTAAGALSQGLPIAVATVGVALGLVRGGLARRMPRTFTLWMLFRALMSAALIGITTGSLLWFHLWTSAVIGLDTAFLLFLLSFPEPRVGRRGLLLVALGGIAFEVAFLLDHCVVFCFAPSGLLRTGPLDFPEVFDLLYPLGGWVLARGLVDARAERPVAVFAALLLVLGGFYSTIGSYEWFAQVGYPGSLDGYEPTPWVPVIVAVQSSAVLATVPGSIVLARKLRGGWRWGLLGAVGLAAVLGVVQNLLPPGASDVLSSALVTLPLLGALGAFDAATRGHPRPALSGGTRAAP